MVGLMALLSLLLLSRPLPSAFKLPLSKGVFTRTPLSPPYIRDMSFTRGAQREKIGDNERKRGADAVQPHYSTVIYYTGARGI